MPHGQFGGVLENKPPSSKLVAKGYMLLGTM